MRKREERKLIEGAGKEGELSSAISESIVEHSLKFVARTIKAGKFEGVTLPGLGTIWVKQGKLDYYERIHRARQPGTDRPGAEADSGVQEDH